MGMLSPEQLTGRTRSHVVVLAEHGCALHPRAAEAWRALRSAAAAAGFDLAPVSAFRNFERQRIIWNAKFSGARPLLDRTGQPLDVRAMEPAAIIDAILLWSALPGASRHHWGTEVDVVDRASAPADAPALLVPEEYAAGGRFAALDAWLSRHGESFGFYRPYDRDRGGVQPEPWHLSFAPVAAGALAQLEVEVLRAALQSAELEGAELVHARLPQIHARYVCAVAAPGPTALAAPALAGDGISPAARPA